MPDRRKVGALLCHRERGGPGRPAVEVTYWADVAEAHQAQAQAQAELASDRCGPECIGVHTVIALELDLDPVPRAKRDAATRFLFAASARPRRRLAHSAEGVTSGHAHAV